MKNTIDLIVRNAIKYDSDIVYVCDVLDFTGKKKRNQIYLILESMNTLLPLYTWIKGVPLEKFKRYRVDGGKIVTLLGGNEIHVIDARDIQYMIITSKRYYFDQLVESGIFDSVCYSILKKKTISKNDLLTVAFLIDSFQEEFFEKIQEKFREIRKSSVNESYLKKLIFDKISYRIHAMILSQIDIDSHFQMDYEEICRFLDISYENAISFVRSNFVYHEILEKLIKEILNFYRNFSSGKYESKYLKAQGFWISLRNIIKQNRRKAIRRKISSHHELLEILNGTMNGKGNLVLVNGKAGVGKTYTLYSVFNSREDTVFLTTLRAVADQLNSRSGKKVYTVAEAIRKRGIWNRICSNEIKNIIIDEFTFFSIYDIPLLNYIFAVKKNLIICGDIMQARNPEHFSLFSLFYNLSIFDVYDLDWGIKRTDRIEIEIFSTPDESKMKQSDVVLVDSHLKRIALEKNYHVLTVQKAQGTEYSTVYCILDYVDERTLYTAITRAKKKCYIQTSSVEKVLRLIYDLRNAGRLPEIEIFVDRYRTYNQDESIILKSEPVEPVERQKDTVVSVEKIHHQISENGLTENIKPVSIPVENQTDHVDIYSVMTKILSREYSVYPEIVEEYDTEEHLLAIKDDKGETVAYFDIDDEEELLEIYDEIYFRPVSIITQEKKESGPEQITQNITQLVLHAIQSEIFHTENKKSEQEKTRKRGRKPSTSLKIIEILKQHPEGLTFREIMLHTGISKSSLIKLLNILKKKNNVVYRNKKYYINEGAGMRKEEKDRVMQIITEEVYLMLQRINDRIRCEDLEKQETIDEKLQKKYIRQDELSLLHWKQ